jgi:aspartate/methionine/tyrosine aminotransferase
VRDPELSSRVLELHPSIIRDMFSRRKKTSIDLSLGEPATPTEPELLDRAISALKEGPQGYTDTGGFMSLREAIAQHFRFPGREKGENAIATVGSEEAVYLAMLSVLDAGDEVLVPDPGYPAYQNIAKLIGAKSVSYEIKRETGLVARAEAIAPKITERTRLLILNSPSNPFGTIDSAEELEKIARLAEKHSFTVISDEIYRDLYYGTGEVTSICRMTNNSIFIGGLSKSCSMTGLRLGFMIGSARFVKQAMMAHQMIVTCAPRISQLAAIEVFKEPARLKTHVKHYQLAREAIRGVADQIPADAPLFLGDGAFYVILDVSKYAKGDPMALAIDLLEKEDVVVVPGNAFGVGGAWFWRISYSVGAAAAREGMVRIGRFLKARGK